MKAKRGDVAHKLKIARGQLDGILQMIEADRYCVDISNQIMATQALLKSANLSHACSDCKCSVLERTMPFDFAILTSG